jgi:hypothetical protein
MRDETRTRRPREPVRSTWSRPLRSTFGPLELTMRAFSGRAAVAPAGTNNATASAATIALM